mgnify:CR=1 FL=1
MDEGSEASAAHAIRLSHPEVTAPEVTAIVIGRNEGARLSACLTSLQGCKAIIYVDSGSTDNSLAIAQSLGATVVELDMRIPFTAARARNAGFVHARAIGAADQYVQFVDGDCEVIAGWIVGAVEFLDTHPEFAVVCGQRHERYPDRSIYNALCDREWNTPVGEAEACGGDALMRAEAFMAVGGYTDTQIAHEEPELCGRLRRAGFRVFRIDLPMTLHDAAILRLAQFYKRNRRAGFGIAQCLILTGRAMDRTGLVMARRFAIWGMGIPLAILIASLAVGPAALAGLLIYPAQIVRHAIRDPYGAGGGLAHRLHVAALFMLCKFAEAHGAVEFFIKRALGARMSAIVYK